jgi:RecA-family ATPase
MPLKLLPDILAEADTRPTWICDPFVVRGGITFLHGKTSIGKSPLTWELARCADQGLDFLGHPTARSRVLYLEADSAEPLLRPRLRLLTEPRGSWAWAFLSGTSMDLCNEGHSLHRLLAQYYHEYQPDLVIWNTLRQFYKGSNIDSDIVTRVYNAMYRAFPGAGHVMVAHDRKGSTDANATAHEDEDFAGSNAWRDLATVALHLVPRGTQAGPYLSLEHTKSQVSELTDPLKLTLAPNGTTLTPLTHPRQADLLALMAREGVTILDSRFVILAQKELKLSRNTLFRIWRQSH